MKPRARPPAERIEDILLGPARLQALYVAVRLGIPDMVKDGPRSSTLLASSAGVHPEALHRLLRFLVADGVFSLGEGGRFAATPLSNSLTMDAPGEFRQRILNTAMRTWDAWRDVLYAVETGMPAFERVHGMSFVEDQARNGGWLARERGPALTSFGAVLAKHLGGAGCVVVAGSGAAALLAGVLTKRPGVRGVACDAPAAEEWSREALGPLGERGRFLPMDPAGSVPTTGEACVLVRQLRECADDAAAALLGRWQAAMAPGARLLVAETLLPEGGEAPRETLLADLELLLTCSGKERTEQEYRRLLHRAGFRFEACEAGKTGMLSLLVATKGLL